MFDQPPVRNVSGYREQKNDLLIRVSSQMCFMFRFLRPPCLSEAGSCDSYQFFTSSPSLPLCCAGVVFAKMRAQ